MGRKKLRIWLPNEETWKRFVTKVAEIYGQTYGKTGEELEEAILLCMEKHGNVSEAGTPSHEKTRTHEEKKGKKPRGKHSNKDVMYDRSLTKHKYAIMKESLSEDLERPIPENKSVMAEEVIAIMSRARKV